MILCILLAAGLDFENTTLEFRFGEADELPNVVCRTVQITDDNIGNEPDEQFSVRLIDYGTLDRDVVIVDPDEACITITDNDSKSVFSEKVTPLTQFVTYVQLL